MTAKSRVGVIPEDLALFDNLTAREYLTFIGRMYLLERETIRGRIDELLHLLGLHNDEKKLTLEYSHGMKKKLALAAALLPNPDLLFLDEPFEGVDAVTSRVIRDLLTTYVGRGFSGDKGQLVPLIMGAIAHGGAAFLDVISPCVAFNNHAGSTRSYDHVREHNEAVSRIDFIDLAPEVHAQAEPGQVIELPQADGSVMRLRNLHADYDPTNRVGALARLDKAIRQNEMVTGLIYLDEKKKTLGETLELSETPIVELPPEKLRPPKSVLDDLLKKMR